MSSKTVLTYVRSWKNGKLPFRKHNMPIASSRNRHSYIFINYTCISKTYISVRFNSNKNVYFYISGEVYIENVR